MATSMPPAKPDTKAQPDPFQQPALANALMVGKTFTKLAPPGSSGGLAVGRPAYPAQRGEGFQQGSSAHPGTKPTATDRIRQKQAARASGNKVGQTYGMPGQVVDNYPQALGGGSGPLMNPTPSGKAPGRPVAPTRDPGY